MKSKHRAINGKLVRSHVIGCHARFFYRRDDNGYNRWRGMFWGQQFVSFSWEDHRAVLCNTTTTHSSVNQFSKPWFCEILPDTFRDSCQCLRTSVDYLIFLITLQVCKFLDVTSASPAPLRKNFPTVAAIVVSSAQTTCVTADHVRPNNFHIYHAITFIFRVIFWFHHAINLL